MATLFQDLSGSAWSNVGEKMRILAPYLWPHKSNMVKLRVFVCFILLVLARFINVYVPIYNKLLSKNIRLKQV